MTEAVDPIQKAVDDYLAMQAKAAAWDMLLVKARAAQSNISPPQLVAVMEDLLTSVRTGCTT